MKKDIRTIFFALSERLSNLVDYLFEVEEQIEQLEELKYFPKGISYDKDKVQTSCVGDSMITVHVRSVELLARKMNAENNISKCIRELNRYISYISDENRRCYARMRFIDFKTISEISRETGRTKRSIYQAFDKIYEEVEKVLDFTP